MGTRLLFGLNILPELQKSRCVSFLSLLCEGKDGVDARFKTSRKP